MHSPACRYRCPTLDAEPAGSCVRARCHDDPDPKASAVRVYNFSAGPATMPLEVLERARSELLDWRGSGMSVMEMSHRSKEFVGIAEEAEARLREIIEAERIETVALARYMQVLSEQLCADFPGRIINIHHSLLPSFKGARPYSQAHERGVKVIGATAHYVTSDLDEGPIIEQDFRRVDHRMSPTQLATTGAELEAMAFARALRWHVERRVVLRGRRTIVFD